MIVSFLCVLSVCVRFFGNIFRLLPEKVKNEPKFWGGVYSLLCYPYTYINFILRMLLCEPFIFQGRELKFRKVFGKFFGLFCLTKMAKKHKKQKCLICLGCDATQDWILYTKEIKALHTHTHSEKIPWTHEYPLGHG